MCLLGMNTAQDMKLFTVNRANFIANVESENEQWETWVWQN